MEELRRPDKRSLVKLSTLRPGSGHADWVSALMVASHALAADEPSKAGKARARIVLIGDLRAPIRREDDLEDVLLALATTLNKREARWPLRRNQRTVAQRQSEETMEALESSGRSSWAPFLVARRARLICHTVTGLAWHSADGGNATTTSIGQMCMVLTFLEPRHHSFGAACCKRSSVGIESVSLSTIAAPATDSWCSTACHSRHSPHILARSTDTA